MAFLVHLVINKTSFYVSKKAKAKIFVTPMLDSHLFDVQYFWLIMTPNAQSIMVEGFNKKVMFPSCE